MHHTLAASHDVTTMSIISSSKIEGRVRGVLKVLLPGDIGADDITKATKPALVILRARSKVASKLVSVVEIAKREAAKAGGTWYEYCAVKGVMEENKKAKGGKGDDDIVNEESGMQDDDEELDFSTMKTPFERALEDDPRVKVRAVPVMRIYLSSTRVELLKRAYGEQTNAKP